jgi:prolipoprotein diacylglyceryltransferase
MPVRRKELADSQYIRVLLASIVGIPFFAIVTGIGYVLHENLFETSLMSTVVVNTSLLLSHPLILVGLVYPLTLLVKEGGKQDVAIVMCVFASIAI